MFDSVELTAQSHSAMKPLFQHGLFMSGSLTITPPRRALSLVVASLAVVILAGLVAQQSPVVDKDIFEHLIQAFGETGTQTTSRVAVFNWLSLAGVLNAVGLLVFAAGETFLTVNLTPLPRTLGSVSLLVLSLMYQYGLWHFFQTEAHPLAFIYALAGGFVAGMYIRALEERRREMETHYYELKIKNKELLETRLSLLKQDEVERRTLAADLHDQVLNDLKQVVQRFDRYVENPDPDNAVAIRKMTNQIMHEIREVMDSLSPSVLEHLGLGAAIEDCLRRGSDRSGFKVRFKSKMEQSEVNCLSMVEQGLLYRLAQETITNICKHAGATTVRATLEKEDDSLLIRIADDGKGIDPAKARGDSRGMKYQRYRADLIGATIGWKPGDSGKGTTVEIRLNLSERVVSDREEQLEEGRGLTDDKTPSS